MKLYDAKLRNIMFAESFEILRRKPTKLYDVKITEHYICLRNILKYYAVNLQNCTV